MARIFQEELSEDEVLLAEDLGLSDYITYDEDDEVDENNEAMTQLETPETS